MITRVNKIDDAINELLEPLGGGWRVRDIRASHIDVTRITSPVPERLAVTYVAIIENDEGLTAEGQGQTLGDAIAMAFVVVQKQALRSHGAAGIAGL